MYLTYSRYHHMVNHSVIWFYFIWCTYFWFPGVTNRIYVVLYQFISNLFRFSAFFRRFLSIWPLFEANSGFLSIFLAFCLEYVSHLVDWSKLEKRSRLGSRSRGAPHWTISLKSGTPFNTVYRSVWIQAELKYLEDYEILLIVRSDQKILICYTYMVWLTEIRLLNQFLC